MRRRGHIAFTFLFTAIAIYLIDRRYLDLAIPIMGLGVLESVLASALPDIAEPGRGSDHRRGFHSWRVLAACVLTCAVGLYMMPQDTVRWHALFFIPWGYATHLLADALTPAGLPL